MSEAIMIRIERSARARRARYVGELFATIAARLARLWARGSRGLPR